ncbi:uncharacterized protein LOC124683756 isoform X2 [Lolium rigidum]|uniref:uncharacterized protein LOC124683756 isoform X2 n=1 Tax=Lolium rigidum TaxID=89674 RepID=UPI001F5CD998|nr:uncharacterized protein LOC124683756 isoform X2 [Lolium rigidum]
MLGLPCPTSGGYSSVFVAELLMKFQAGYRRSRGHVPRGNMDSSSNDNAAPAYMLTNLVDATTTFQIVDIQRYMMESIPIILQPSGPSDACTSSPEGLFTGDSIRYM